MSNSGGAAAAALRHPIAKGWFVHGVTASGAVCGMLGIIAVSDREPREAVLWLAVAMVLDGVDGPAARAWCVRDHVPRIDGYTLDLIVDFVTCIVIPVIFENRVKAVTPLRRAQTPEDIANLVAFLVSDQALNITGQAINVDGGAVMH